MKNSKIRVGISAKFNSKAPAFYGETNRHIQYLETSVAKWIGKNGALPFMIPSEIDEGASNLDVASYASELDALILQGGNDIHPNNYGRQIDEKNKYSYDIARDKYEFDLVKEFISQNKPIFGICRGLQLLNVYFGGSLHGDLEASGYTKHFDKGLEEKHFHKILFQQDSVLGQVYKQPEFVSSIHHQGIEKLGEGLQIESTSEDGLIEAFSKIDSKHFILAVQWHPEFHYSENLMNSEKMFILFLNAARNRKFFGHLNTSKPKKIKMGKSNSLTLGVEFELQLLNTTDYDLCPKAPELIKATSKNTEKIKTEIFQSMVEIETAICEDAHQVHNDLKNSMDVLLEEAERLNLAIGSYGTHPFAKYSERKLTDSDRYKYLIESKQWIARRIAIFGLHCHVGAKSPEEAITLYRFYLSVAPLLLSISASSAYFQSEDTGLFSVRSTFFESTPAGGHPPIITSWSEFEGLLSKLYKSKSIVSPKDLWWDVRPSLNYGTIEIRICDMMPTLLENTTLIALIHLLGHCYLKYKNEYSWPHLSEWSYRENKWRAIRYGINFEYILTDDGATTSSRDFIKKLISDFSEEVNILGYQKQMNYLSTYMLESSPAERMKKRILGGESFADFLAKESKTMLA